MNRMFYLLFVVIAVVFVAGCTTEDTATNAKLINPTNDVCHPIDYSSGVYYFPCYEVNFGNALVAWKNQHPDRVITAIAASDRGGYGWSIGYFATSELRVNYTMGV